MAAQNPQGLEKKSLQLPFQMGIDGKTDPLQGPPGQMESLVNCNFNKAKRIDKRNGFGSVTTLGGGASPTGQQITSYQEGSSLVAYGPNQVTIYDSQAASWYNAGSYFPMSVNTQSAVRNNADNRNGDIAIDSSTGRYCCVVTPWLGSSQYQVFDNAGVAITTLVTIAGSYARVWKLGTNFVITYHDATDHLAYIAIPIATPLSPGSAVQIQASCYPTVPVASTITVSSVVINSFEYGFSSNCYTVAYKNNGTHGFEVGYFEGDQNGDATHVDFNVSIVNGTTTRTDVQSAINNVPNAPSLPQGSVAVNIFSTATSGASTVATAAAAAMAGGKNPNHDGFIGSDSNLYLVVTLAAGTLQVHKLTTALVDTSTNIAAADASLVSITEDIANSLVYVSWAVKDSLTIKCATYNHSLVQQLAPTTVVTQTKSTVNVVAGFPIMALTSVASGGAVRIIYQDRNWYQASQAGVAPPLYFLSATQRCDNLQHVVMNSAGTITQASATLKRGAALASKPTILNGVGYVVINYQSPTEPTNFLIDFSGNILAKMGPSKSINTSQNACGWYLPQITQLSSPTRLIVPHLVIDQLISIQKIPGTPTPTGIFSYAGLNFDTLQFNLSTASSAEIADVLHLAGGFPYMYDTTNVVEHGFHCFPDVMNITANGGTPGAAFVQYWYAVYEWMDSTGKIHRSAPSFPATSGIKNSGGTFTFVVSTLRLTAKSNVQVCLYRWSQSQPAPYFVGSVTNDPTKDAVLITDTSGSIGNDVAIAGNRQLYTWGGELENISAPACIAMSMFRARLFVVSSEDQNALYFTKQCIEDVPAEFADGFKMFIAPTISSSGPTGTVQTVFPLDDKLIIFKTNALYYIVGNGPDNTGQFDDFSDPIFITSSVGSNNQNSAVMIPDGIMFQSTKGIWILGRDLSTNYIGAPAETVMLGRTITSAVAIPTMNQVRFTLDNGNILVYDYFFKQWGIYTLANGAVPQDSCIWNGYHTLFNTDGTVTQETPGVYLDGATPLAMSFKTGWFAMTGVQGFQRAYWFNLLGTYQSAHNLSIQVDYDYTTTQTQNCGLITADGSVPEQYRIFFTKQKCQAFQITVTETVASAGAGLTFSGLNLVVGGKFGQYPRLPAAKSSS